MRARSALSARRRTAAGTLRFALLAPRKPGVCIRAHPLGGAKHASLKDTAEPLCLGGTQ